MAETGLDSECLPVLGIPDFLLGEARSTVFPAYAGIPDGADQDQHTTIGLFGVPAYAGRTVGDGKDGIRGRREGR